MTEKKDFEESVKFVAQNFEEGSLLPRKGWQRFRLAHRISNFRRNIAAACIATIVLAASASIYYLSSATSETESNETFSHSSVETTETTAEKTVKIEFKDTPLKQVVAEIEQAYDVTVDNVPEEEIRLTISYEGTASDVVETINDLLNTNLTISKNQTELPSKE